MIKSLNSPFYIIDRVSYKAESIIEIKRLLLHDSYRIEEIIFGPSWNPAIYFYLMKVKENND